MILAHTFSRVLHMEPQSVRYDVITQEIVPIAVRYMFLIDVVQIQ
jgi:hypothetical protein